jgi:hypothetical protein
VRPAHPQKTNLANEEPTTSSYSPPSCNTLFLFGDEYKQLCCPKWKYTAALVKQF